MLLKRKLKRHSFDEKKMSRKWHPCENKKHNDIFSYFIQHNFNNSLFSLVFLSELKKADIIPIHKKKSEFDIENYCPVSILPVLSKIYEGCMFDKRIVTLIKFSLNISVDSDKVTALNIAFFLWQENWKKVWTIVV